MSLRNRLALPVVLSALAVLAACGGGSNSATPPPSGGFSASDLNGTYVFSTSGFDANNEPLMIVGDFTVAGTGTISGGALTFADGSVGIGSNQAITGGTYTITQDGRGKAQLLNSSSLGNVTIDFVLASSDHGLVTEYDTNGSGSGTLDLQGSVAQSDVNGQSYAFSVTGTGSSGVFASAGAFTLGSNGAATTGIQDVTSFNTTTGITSTDAGISIATSSAVTIGSSPAPGAAQISSGAGVFTFDVYAIDPTHFKVVETDGIDYSAGDVFTQATSLPSGTLAFTMAGVDTGLAPLAIGGLLPTSSGTISGGIEDYNDAGTANSATSISGSLSALAGGRSILTLSGLENGAANQTFGNYSFAAYPTSGGTLLIEVDNAGITGGVAMAQTNTSFAASTGYGVNLSAVNTNSDEDDIAEFTATSSGFSGLIDFNDQGSLNFDQTLNGTYTNLSAGRYSLTSNQFNGNFYTVDGSTVLFLETDDTQVGNGVFAVQTAPSSSSASTGSFSIMHQKPVAGRHSKWHSAK